MKGTPWEVRIAYQQTKGERRQAASAVTRSHTLSRTLPCPSEPPRHKNAESRKTTEIATGQYWIWMDGKSPCAA